MSDKRDMEIRADTYDLVRLQVIYSMREGDWTVEDLIAWLELRASRCRNAEESE